MISLVAVSALIQKDSDYLFIRQNKTDGAYPGTLHLPGGRIEPDENPLEAIAREVEEEVGLTGLKFKVADFDWDTIPYKGQQTSFIFLRFTATLQNGAANEPTPASDASEIIWIAKSELIMANLNPPTIRFLGNLHLL